MPVDVISRFGLGLLVCLFGLSPIARAQDHFARVMDDSIPVADGFDFPVGDRAGQGGYVDLVSKKAHRGWYVATGFGKRYSLGIHPGEDWNGRGGGNTDLGQAVRAVARGRVVFAGQCGKQWGRVVVIEHAYFENHHRRIIRSLYAHLGSMAVKQGQVVKRREQIGTIGQDPEKRFPAHLHLEMRTDLSLETTYWPSAKGKDLAWIKARYRNPSRFIRAHRKLFVPRAEDHLLVIHQDSYLMRHYMSGQLKGEYKVSFGQEAGRKRIRGDLRTPKGMYFVIHRHKGEFSGRFGAYFGGHWIKINYPNPFDAAWGREQGLIDRRQERSIGRAWNDRQPTLGNTRLGGGIGFHGWIEEWSDDGPRHLSWGCIVMHNRDVEKLYPLIPLGAMVIII